MATSAYGSIDGVFWPPVIWLMASFACGLTKWRLVPEWLIDGFLIDVFYPEIMATSTYGSIDGDSYLGLDWCILSLKDDDFCQIVD